MHFQSHRKKKGIKKDGNNEVKEKYQNTPLMDIIQFYSRKTSMDYVATRRRKTNG